MSIIVVVRKGQTAAIAADTMSSQGDLIVPGDAKVAPTKIRKFGPTYVGVVGSTAHQQVIDSVFKHHEDLFDLTSTNAIFETLRSIHTILKDDYFLLPKEDDNEQEYESNQLFGVVCAPTGIFSFQSFRDVDEYHHFWACGSGTDLALGSLESTYSRDDDPLKIAEEAVRVACKYDKDCGLPLVSHTLKLQ